MVQKVLYIIGAILVIVGAWGYFQNPVFSIFEVDAVHNIVHLATGVLLILAGIAGDRWSKIGAQVFGVVYALVAIVGLVTGGDTVLGFFASNLADDILHVVLALVLLYFGFAGGKSMQKAGGGAPIPTPPPPPPAGGGNPGGAPQQ